MPQDFCKRQHEQKTARRTRANGKTFCYECEKIMWPIRNKKWRDRNKAKTAKSNRKWHLKVNYGITIEEWDLLFIQQEGKCASCDRSGIRLVVDHNHKTGKLRGLLCDNCNCTIGLVHEDTGTLVKLINYLGRCSV